MKRKLSMLALMVVVVLAVGLVNVPYAFGNEAEPTVEEPVEGVNGQGARGSGSIKTTDKDGVEVNENVFYESKQDVYVRGSNLPQGNYYIKVTDPNGTLLGESLEATISVGESGEFPNTQLWSILTVNGTQGYKDTGNKGGEYKVWISQNRSFPNNESETDNFKVRKDCAIKIEKTADKASVISGEQVTFTIKVTNEGKNDLKNVKIEDVFDGSLLIYVGDLVPQNDNGVYKKVSWDVGGLSKGASMQYTITFEAGLVTEETETPNKATASCKHGNEKLESEDSAEVTILPPQSEDKPGLSIEKTPATQGVLVGAKTVFEIEVENTGDVALSDVTIRDSFDAEYLSLQSVEEWVSEAWAPKSYITDDKLGTYWGVGTLQPGGSKKYQATFEALKETPEDGSTYNKAQALGKYNQGDVQTDEVQVAVMIRESTEPPQDLTGKLTIVKVIEGVNGNNGPWNGIPEFKVTVTDPQDNEETYGITTAETLVLNELALGTYKISESQIPEGYELVGIEEGTVTLTEETSEATVTVTNRVKTGGGEPTTGTLTIVKVIEGVNGNNGPRNGFPEFTVTITGTEPLVYSETRTITTVADVVLDELDFGTYHISETDIPGGYELVSIDHSSVTLTEDDSEATVKVTNRKKGGLQIWKMFEYGNSQVLLPASVDFKITGPSYPEGETFTLDAPNGWGSGQYFSVRNLIPGSYTITEENVDKDKWDVLVSAAQVEVLAGETAEVNITNTWKSEEEPEVRKLTITKTAAKGTVNEGDIVTFTITVKNAGNVTIKDIMLADEFEDKYLDIIQVKCGNEIIKLDDNTSSGLESWSVGDLAPGESKSYTVTFKAANVSSNVTTTNTVTAYYGDDYPPKAKADVTIRDTSRPPKDDDDRDPKPKPKPKPDPEPEPEPEPEPPIIIEIPDEEPPVGVPVIPVEEEPVPKGDLPFTGGSELPAMLLGMGILAAGVWLRRRK